MSEEEVTIEESESSAESSLPQLTFAESRVLGCLLEKEATTPDYYPLTLNALHTACNQSSNREPVVDFGTDEVEEAMEGLRYKKLSLLVHQAGARVPKCKHTIENEFPYITDAQKALLCVLLLRGRQTVGELRQRTQRMHPFADIERTQNALDQLKEMQPDSLVREIPAGGGHRVPTFVHLLCGEPDESASHSPSAAVASPSAIVPESSAASWRQEMETEISTLKETVLHLQNEVERLQRELGM